MQFEPLPVEGARLIRLDQNHDQRGFFARTHCRLEYEAAGLPGEAVQSSLSFNRARGTVRGMHLQLPPSREAKTVRCIRGAIHDVLVDLRPQSPSYLKHAAVRLDQETRLSVYIPPGIAHGFQTLEDNTEVLYTMTDFHAPDLARGYRWSDPAFGISWPLAVSMISDRDRGYADFDAHRHAAMLAGNGHASH
jgi:dTDP-4-dehydrorhamnose 3,5-epimerase